MAFFAAIRALEFSLEIGITNAILEGDSEMVIMELGDHASSTASYANLLNDANFISRYFSQLHYPHIRRECNNVAYDLVRYINNISNFLI